MSLFPSSPKPQPKPANAPIAASASTDLEGASSPTAPPSLVSTSPQGLTRKAKTQKTSLIGGS